MGSRVAITPPQRLPDAYSDKTENGLEAYKRIAKSEWQEKSDLSRTSFIASLGGKSIFDGTVRMRLGRGYDLMGL